MKCPFCENNPKITLAQDFQNVIYDGKRGGAIIPGKTGYRIRCKTPKCVYFTHIFNTKGDALAWWSRRANIIQLN